jgi:hypothetical protein
MCLRSFADVFEFLEGQPVSERRDYVAIKDGWAYALMAEELATSEDVRDFYDENPGAEIRLMPTAQAVELHRRYLDQHLSNLTKGGA